MNLDNLRLKKVTENDLEFLYDLLLERDPKANISHKKMPTFAQHKRFVRSKPYLVWYIIMKNNEKLGSIYLSKTDEIGIFLKKDHQKAGIGKRSIKLLMKKHPRKRFLANVSPKNYKSQEFFKKLGFNLIQYTYERTR